MYSLILKMFRCFMKAYVGQHRNGEKQNISRYNEFHTVVDLGHTQKLFISL